MPVTTLPARRVRFRDLLYGVARRAGMAPDTEGVPEPVAAEITEALNTCYKIAWEYYDWPETLYSGRLTMANVTAPVPPVEGISRIFWENFSPELSQIYSLNEPVATDPQPSIPTLKGACIPFQLGPDGIYLSALRLTDFLVFGKLAAPQFTHVPFVAMQVYQIGDLVYNPEDGCCYRCLTGGTYADVYSENWTYDLPLKYLAEAVKAGGHAGFERAEEQHTTAALLEASMQEFLDHEIDQLELHGHGTIQRRTSGRRR